MNWEKGLLSAKTCPYCAEDIKQTPSSVIMPPSRERLLALTENDLKKALETYLTPIEIGSILKRRDALVEHVDNLIAARGEDAVFY